MEGLKILNLTASHPYQRAGIVAFDFHKNLQNNGCESILLTMQLDDFKDESILSYRKGKYDQILKRGFQLLSSTRKKQQVDWNYYFTGEDVSKNITSTQRIIDRLGGFKPDVIVVSFTDGFLSTKNFHELYEYFKVPIYWYIMDMRPMTGGCGYAWNCKGYQKSCGKCPAIHSTTENDQSRKNLLFNKEYLSKTNLTVLVASDLQKKQALKSSNFKDKRIAKLLISIDSKVFRPMTNPERIVFAKNYKLVENKKHLFFGAVKPEQKRKGFNELMDSLLSLSKILSTEEKKQVHLLIAGNLTNEMNQEISKTGFGFTFLGFLNHEELAQSLAFSDAFLCPTLQDSGPMMVNQSLMAGTPVVSFEMGISIDLVSEEKGTGILVEMGHIENFAKGIKKILKDPIEIQKKNRERCRTLAMEKYSYKAQFCTFKKIVQEQ